MNEWMNADYSVISSNAILSEQKKVFRWEKSSTLTRFFWDTNMTDMTSRERLKYDIQINWHRLFTVPYYPVRSSRSGALRYGLPSCMSVKTTIWKSRRPPLMVGRATSRRSHGKIGDCEQSITDNIPAFDGFHGYHTYHPRPGIVSILYVIEGSPTV